MTRFAELSSSGRSPNGNIRRPRPALPQVTRYPKRFLGVAVGCFGSFLAWATLAGIATLARNTMA